MNATTLTAAPAPGVSAHHLVDLNSIPHRVACRNMHIKSIMRTCRVTCPVLVVQSISHMLSSCTTNISPSLPARGKCTDSLSFYFHSPGAVRLMHCTDSRRSLQQPPVQRVLSCTSLGRFCRTRAELTSYRLGAIASGPLFLGLARNSDGNLRHHGANRDTSTRSHYRFQTIISVVSTPDRQPACYGFSRFEPMDASVRTTLQSTFPRPSHVDNPRNVDRKTQTWFY